MTDRTLSEFTAQLASASPAPGGGGAAALTGALAASLAAMAANVTAATPRYADRTDALAPLAAELFEHFLGITPQPGRLRRFASIVICSPCQRSCSGRR